MGLMFQLLYVSGYFWFCDAVIWEILLLSRFAIKFYLIWSAFNQLIVLLHCWDKIFIPYSMFFVTQRFSTLDGGTIKQFLALGPSWECRILVCLFRGLELVLTGSYVTFGSSWLIKALVSSFFIMCLKWFSLGANSAPILNVDHSWISIKLPISSLLGRSELEQFQLWVLEIFLLIASYWLWLLQHLLCLILGNFTN